MYIGVMVGLGMWSISRGAMAGTRQTWRACSAIVAVCALVSGLKVRLPGIEGTMSVNFLFILMGVSQMSLGETIMLGCTGTLVQCIWKSKNPVKPVRLIFSVCSMATAVTACYEFCGLFPNRTRRAFSWRPL